MLADRCRDDHHVDRCLGRQRFRQVGVHRRSRDDLRRLRADRIDGRRQVHDAVSLQLGDASGVNQAVAADADEDEPRRAGG